MAKASTEVGSENSGVLALVIKIAAITFALFHLYTGVMGPFQSMLQRSVHVGGGFAVFFLISLQERLKKKQSNYATLADSVLLIITVIASTYILICYDRIVDPFFEPARLDVILGLLMTLVVLEVTRRLIGWFIPLLALLVLVYALFGNIFPGTWQHAGVSLDYVVEVLYLSDRGLWGLVTGISATIIAAFIILGSVLFATGGGKAFIDLSCWIVGDSYGGAAKLATVASSLFGMISGSGSANVATTGAFTIPLMKRIGYQPEFAAAVESTASEGGQIMPPIMGAAAFIMAEILGMPYFGIAMAAAIPAFLFYFGAFFSVHLEAKKRGYRGVPKDEIPNIKELLYYKNSLPIFLPVFTVIFYFIKGYTPVSCAMRALFVAVVFYIGSDLSNWKHRLKVLVSALEQSSKDMLSVIALIVCAQILLCLISTTGVGVKFTNMIILLGHNNMILAGVCAMIGTTILGMGLPTTAAYLLGSAVMSPALIRLGVPAIAAHFFIFYYACFSGLTPPVCGTVYIGAAIAGSNWLKTAWIAMRLAVGGYIVPFMFLSSPALLLVGEKMEIVQSAATSLIGIFAMAIGAMGYFLSHVSIPNRAVFCLAGVLMVHPGTATDIVGIGALLVALTMHIFMHKKTTYNLNCTAKKGE
ncbi:MAG: TRAP transporter fused permease subunit [Synergistaceae bacterium]|nr:TRAP transporter fused permease subunit [Synergistaceae bacterium]